MTARVTLPSGRELAGLTAAAIALAERMIAERPGLRRVPIIMEAVSVAFDVCLKDMQSPRRLGFIVQSRQVAMAIARVTTPCSLKAIARDVNLDHTTVIHGVAKYLAMVEGVIAERER